MTSSPAGRLGPSGLADQPHLTGTRAHQRERALIRYRRPNGTYASAFRWLFEVIWPASGPCETWTPRWREGDSNPRSPAGWTTLSRQPFSSLRHFPFRRRDRVVLREGPAVRILFAPASVVQIGRLARSPSGPGPRLRRAPAALAQRRTVPSFPLCRVPIGG